MLIFVAFDMVIIVELVFATALMIVLMFMGCWYLPTYYSCVLLDFCAID